MMKKLIFPVYLIVILGAGQLMAQSQIEYPHCNCVEKLNYSSDNKSKLEGEYQLICKGQQIVTGQYINGLKTGKWTTKNVKGTAIKSAEYIEGKLNGTYDLFYFDGAPKLRGIFINGTPDGQWQFFNDKGKTIKSGSYEAGRPVGVWTIFDKSGKKVIASYDFNSAASANPSAAPYFKKGGIQRDDQSGEWYIIYYPERDAQSAVQPIGGYTLSCDFFLKLMTIPPTMMDTYTDINVKLTVEVENNTVRNIDSDFGGFTYRPTMPIFPFIVSTNPPAKLKRVSHSLHTLDLLRMDIAETVSLMGPWIGNSTVTIYVPFVLNDIHKF